MTTILVDNRHPSTCQAGSCGFLRVMVQHFLPSTVLYLYLSQKSRCFPQKQKYFVRHGAVNGTSLVNLQV